MTEWVNGPFRVSTDPERMDVAVIHGFLGRSYWARGIGEDVVRRSIRGSLCFGLFDHDRQVGFARAITDGTVCHANVEDGWQAMRIIEALMESLRTRAAVEIRHPA